MNYLNSKKLLTVFCLIVLFTLNNAYAAPKRILYTGNPITVDLTINEERRITFPDAKLVWASVNDKLTKEGYLRADIVNNDVFLTALKPFKKDRNMFGKEGAPDIYLLDLVGTERKVKKQRLIIAKGEDRYAIAEKDKVVIPEKVIKPLQKSIRSPSAGYKTLIDFANREVYAPDRLRGGVSGIYREKIKTTYVSHLLRNNKVSTKAVASWRSGKLHVIAISVTNKTYETVSLSPLNIRGQWKAASFYRSRISPKGSPFDNTTLYLVSNKAFSHAIESHPMIKLAGR